MNIGELGAGMIGLAGAVLINVINNWFKRRKLKADEGKTNAETVKILSEAYSIKTKTEIEIGEQWQKISDNIREDANRRIKLLEDEMAEERRECDFKIARLKDIIDAMQKEIETLKNQKQ